MKFSNIFKMASLQIIVDKDSLRNLFFIPQSNLTGEDEINYLIKQESVKIISLKQLRFSKPALWQVKEMLATLASLRGCSSSDPGPC